MMSNHPILHMLVKKMQPAWNGGADKVAQLDQIIPQEAVLAILGEPELSGAHDQSVVHATLKLLSLWMVENGYRIVRGPNE